MTPFPELPTPVYVVDEARIASNVALLGALQKRAGVRILLALKGFAMYSLFPVIREHLVGATASGLHEALLGSEHFGGEIHVYAPAFRDGEVAQLARFAHHLSFNSVAEYQRHRPALEAATRRVAVGLRVNPEHSEVPVPLYDPCAPGSRLGVRAADLEGVDLGGISGLHFHALCEQNSDVLARTVTAFEKRFGHLLGQMSWVNFGGGHHFTRSNYDLDLFVETMRAFRQRHPHLTVYLEPGEAVALNTGYLVASVLDVIHNEGAIAILDTSATAHMPDVLEMPYRPGIIGAGEAEEKPHTYRLGGLTCLAGDVIGTYSFDKPLQRGDRLVFTDMAHYTMVKNTTFNGVPLPAIAVTDSRTGQSRVVKSFTYADYRERLS